MKTRQICPQICYSLVQFRHKHPKRGNASFYTHRISLFKNARKTAKNEENLRKSRVFLGASFLAPQHVFKAQKRYILKNR